MRLRRLILGVVVAGALSALTAFAAGLTTQSQSLASGTTAVARCDATPNDWVYGSFTKNGNGQVTGLTVSNIASTCQNGQFSLTLTDGVAVGSGGPTPITTCAATCSAALTVAPPLYPAQITAVHAVITGP